MKKNVILLAKQSMLDLSAYNKAKAIHIPFLDTFMLEGAKICIELGVATICLILLIKYPAKRFDNLSTNEEVEKKILTGGIISLLFGVFAYLFLTFF